MAARKSAKSVIATARRLVVKVGSSLVTNQGQGLDRQALARWAAQIAELRKLNREVVLVSSGAVAEGMQRLGWSKRPHAVNELQAAAAVGLDRLGGGIGTGTGDYRDAPRGVFHGHTDQLLVFVCSELVVVCVVEAFTDPTVEKKEHRVVVIADCAPMNDATSQ